MNSVGSPAQWDDVIWPQVETILRLILQTWDAMPPPPRNELEKPIALKLTARLQNAPSRDDYPFRVVPEYMILDDDGREAGRIDIAFMQFVCHDRVYFGVECKRLNSLDLGGLRWYHTEYVNEGIARFTSSKYAEAISTGGMLGFVLNADLDQAIANVSQYVASKPQEIGMAATGVLTQSTACPGESRIRETWHARGPNQSGFLLHHVFLAGDPKAPLRPDPPPDPKAGKSKRKATPRRKRGK
jgi:hypothetical protein